MQRVLSLAVLLTATAFPVLADERMEHAEWVSEFRESTGEASTKEDGMSQFGMLCNDESCRFYYENGIDCEPGNNYPIVIATSAGSMAVETICEPVNDADADARRYWFAELPQFNEALMQSDTVGIAFPLSNGQFKISQFLMNGYGEATERVASGLRARRAEREAREAADRERRIREANERTRKAQEAVERARQTQEAAERARKMAEQEAAERARKAQEAVERARVAAEQQAAERAQLAAEKEAAEKQAEEKLAAENAMKAQAQTAAEAEARSNTAPAAADAVKAADHSAPEMEKTGTETSDSAAMSAGTPSDSVPGAAVSAETGTPQGESR
jgi:chemotaxis protein histidine kinase CheA